LINGNTDTIWRIAEENRLKTIPLARALDVPRVVAHLMVLRGVDSVEEAQRFLDPSIEHVAAPFLMQDMDRAVARITDARARDEHVFVFGDYDVDGITGTAVLVNALRRFGVTRCSWDLPSRMENGYGLSPEHVDAAQQRGVSLIVTVDNGINARAAAERAKALGIDLIITDHHQLEGELPPAVSVVDPAREACPGPHAKASGAAVAFKLGWALTGEPRDVDLVALGTVADIVPLLGENRDLVAVGLRSIQRAPRPGIEALMSVARLELANLTAENIAFQIAPRINAAGRMKEAHLAFDLLQAESPTEARRLAVQLDGANEERKTIERNTLESLLGRAEELVNEGRHSLVLAGSGWHQGVLGIVAAQLQSQFNRPVIVVSIDADGLGRGSGRSAAEFKLVDALSACNEHLVSFGGHAAAAGVTIREEEIEAFVAAFEREARQRMSQGLAPKELDLDALVSLSEMDHRLIKTLDRLQPYGHGNPAPVFCCYGVEVLPNSLRELRGGHIRFSVRQEDKSLQVIGFRMAGILAADVLRGTVDIAFTPQRNTWRDETTIQLVLRDVRSSPREG